jgi:hypothetical protein
VVFSAPARMMPLLGAARTRAILRAFLQTNSSTEEWRRPGTALANAARCFG